MQLYEYVRAFSKVEEITGTFLQRIKKSVRTDKKSSFHVENLNCFPTLS